MSFVVITGSNGLIGSEAAGGLMRTISRVWRGRRDFSTKLAAAAPATSEATHGSR
jgi:hypothetical protein